MGNIIKILTVTIAICFTVFNKAGATDVFRVLDANDGLTDNQVQHLLQLSDGRLIVTTLGNINIYDGAHFNYIHKKENNFFSLADYKGAYHVYVGKDDMLWVKNTHSLACFDLKRMRYIDDIKGLFKKIGIRTQVRDIFLDSDKHIWVVTPEGLLSVEKGKYYTMPADAGNLQDMEVEKDRLYLFFETGEVVCYDCSSAKMLYRLAAYNSSERSLYSSTSLVVKGNNGIFYQLRTGKRSIFLIFDTHKKRWHTILNTPYLLHTIVTTNDGQAYITCAKGYWKFNMNTGKGQLTTQLLTDQGEIIRDAGLNTVFCDSQGGIWIGTYNRGLLYMHPSTYRFSSFYTGKGYNKHDNSHVTYHERSYNMLIKDRRGWIWGGTNDGLRLIKPKGKTQKLIYTDDGLVNNFIHSIVEDRKGDIWVATSCGISRIKINEKDKSLSFTNFTKQDGTLDGEYRNGMGKLLKDGRIFMGGINGYTLFYPDSVTSPHITFNPILTNILIQGEPINTSPPYVHHLNLNHKQNSLSFEFSALNFVTPKHTIYRYRLLGGDDKWHTTEAEKSNGLVDNKGLLHLSFVNLPYGKYSLEVMATTVPDEWRGTICNVTFIINAPWWQSSVAYMIYIGIIISLIILGIFVYLQMMRRRIQQKQKEETLLQRIQDLIKQVDYEQKESDRTKEPKSNEKATPNDTGNIRERMRNEDAEFVRKAAFLVESHINEQGYSVSELSRDLCMERTGLYKKLTALIDESPTLFIRHIRLQKAAEMLSEGKLSISDIAFRTGFSSSSYLSKCFQEEFGCKPSEYHK